MGNGRPRISIIIVNWNGRRFLKECLDALNAQSFKDFEIIFVDNGSTDGSVEFIEKNYPDARLIVNKGNLGFAEGNNAGIRAAKGEYIVMLNNDTKADKNFLHELAGCIESAKGKVGCVASKMVYYSNPKKVNAAGMYALKDGSGRDRGVNEPDSGEWGRTEEVFGACAGAALYSRKALEDVALGGEYMDSSFFAYFEDVDLAYRLRLRGWKTLYCPKALALHHGRGTSRKIPYFNTYYGHANRLKVIIKDMPAGLLLRFLPWILLRQFLEFTYCTFIQLSLAPAKARLKVISELPSLLRKRGLVQSRKTVSDGEFGAFFHPTPIGKIISDRFISKAD